MSSDFYVGYFPMPTSHRRLLRFVIPIALWICVAVAGLSVYGLRRGGPAVWTTDMRETFTGTLIVEPYPMLVDGDHVHLISDPGKVGSRKRLAPHANKTVELSGFRLQRGGRTLIEIPPDDEAITVIDSATGSTGNATRDTTEVPVIRHGEILDAKCFLGAMRPGDGPAHRQCAVLCIEGGQPPLFGIYDSDDPADEPALLTGALGGPMPDSFLTLVGRPVRLEGRRTMIGNLPVIAIDRLTLVGRE